MKGREDTLKEFKLREFVCFMNKNKSYNEELLYAYYCLFLLLNVSMRIVWANWLPPSDFFEVYHE